MAATIELQADDKIVFIGDSITDAERRRRGYAPLGFGYVHFVGNMLLARHPQLNLDLVNTGVSGDTIADMAERWEQDCLAHRPNVLSVLVGVNDLWRLVMEPYRTATAPEEYEVTYDQLLSQAKEQCHCQIVLIEPFLFVDDPNEPLWGALQPYLVAARALAAKHNAVLVPLQQRIDAQIVSVPSARWSQDTVHPYLWAHAWIAQQWLEATGL